MSQPIELHIQATIRTEAGRYTVHLQLLPDRPQPGYRFMTTISSFTPYLQIWLYWCSLPHNSVRLIGQFRPDIETYVKTVIAANAGWRSSVALQTGGGEWTL
jgi:hypothetical protein